MTPSCRSYTILLALLAGCAPDLSPPAWLVTSPTVLAISAEPPEVQPGSAASFHPLAASPNGPLDLSTAAWALCTTPLALTEPGSIAPECLGDLPSAGQGDPVSISTSQDACSLFGSIGASTGSSTTPRPRQPDATGGYYQPIRLELGSQTAFAQERLLCPLFQASLSVSLAYQADYQANKNPIISQLVLIDASGAQLDPNAIPESAAATLSLQWTADSNESFLVFDTASLRLVTQQEVMHVSWFTTAGTFSVATSGADASGVASSNAWTAPNAVGPVYLWAVIRDSRGGQSFIELDANVIEK